MFRSSNPVHNPYTFSSNMFTLNNVGSRVVAAEKKLPTEAENIKILERKMMEMFVCHLELLVGLEREN